MKKSAEFLQGVRDGLPIAVGYFSVSFSFGILCAAQGLSPWIAALISLTNVTSAGQFAGLTVMLARSGLVELILTQLVINSRYALMSLSLTQKLRDGVGIPQRLLIAFANTDEIFAVAMNHDGAVGTIYMLGLESTPILGWTLGSFFGAAASNLLPLSVRSALGIALYGMLGAIVVPVAKKEKSVLTVCLTAIAASLLFGYAPYLRNISSGFAIILCTILAAGIGATFFPVGDTAS